MKPITEASGVRNSWLTLAMKSERMRSTRRASVVSRRVIMQSLPSARVRGARCTSNTRSTGTRSRQLTHWAPASASTRVAASSTSGERRVSASGSPARAAGNNNRMGAFSARRRVSGPTSIAGSRSASSRAAQSAASSAGLSTVSPRKRQGHLFDLRAILMTEIRQIGMAGAILSQLPNRDRPARGDHPLRSCAPYPRAGRSSGACSHGRPAGRAPE